MEDGNQWFCTRCSFSVPVDKQKQEQEQERGVMSEQEEEYSIESYKVKHKYRGINPDVYERYGCRETYSETDGSPEFMFFPIKDNMGNQVGYHRRDINNKRFINIGNTKQKRQLFGQDLSVSGKKLVICEDHLSCMSAYQILNDKYPTWSHSVVSLNNGTGDIASIQDNIEFIKSHEEVLLCFDMDKAGDLITEKTIKLLGYDGVKRIHLPLKDVNDMHQQGKERQFLSAFWSARDYKPSGIVSGFDLEERVLEPIESGLDYKFKDLNRLTYGLRTQQIISIGAGPGAGKSCFINEIIKHLIFEHKEKVGIFSLEESPALTMKKLIGGIVNKRLHLPDTIYNKDEVQEVLNQVAPHISLYDSQGFKKWGDIVNIIRYMASENIKWIFIDPMTALTAHLSSSEANDLLNKIMADISTLVISLDITIFLVSHLNNPKGVNIDHATGAKVLGGQFTGSRALWRWSTDMWGLERDQQAEDEVDRNTVTLRIIKNRLSGETGTLELFFNKESGTLEELELGTGKGDF